MARLTRFTTPQIEIGEYVDVLAGAANNNATIPTTQGQFIRAGLVYNQADYPELYAKIGKVGASVFNTVTSGTTTLIRQILYNNGFFLYSGNGGALASSTDGITWTAVTSGTTSSILTLAYGNGLYVYGGAGGVLASSTDGATWVAGSSGTTSDIQKIIYNNGNFFLGGVGGILATSTNGLDWVYRNSGTTTRISDIVYGNGRFVYVGYSGSLGTSDDNGVTWVTRNSNSLVNLLSLAYGNGLYVYAGVSGSLATSTDAITWTARTSLMPGGASALAANYVNGLYVYSGLGSVVVSSTDGITWRSTPTGATMTTYTITYGNNLYYVGGSGGNIRTATTLTTLGASAFYDINTQFLVPPYNGASLDLSLPSTANSNPINVTYVRAK